MTAEVIPFIPFNPLDKKNLGASVAEALLAGKIYPLDNLPKFRGAGIYAIYYSGTFSPYEEIAKRNQQSKQIPIYVGKAVPSGSRKGGEPTVNSKAGKALLSRLSEHAESIRAVDNLDINDFTCRFLVVEDIWIPLGESLLIARYSPVWNSLVDGFGNHDPGKGRHNGKRPRWDVLHPGRDWAAKCKDRPETSEDIISEVESHLRNMTFPTSDKFILPE